MNKKVLIAVDTSGLYNHEERVKDVLEVLQNTCQDYEIDLITFDARGIVEHDISDFLNTEIIAFMESPDYSKVLVLFEDYDKQHLFSNGMNLFKLEEQLIKYQEEHLGFVQ